jgi:hypothetical protein
MNDNDKITDSDYDRMMEARNNDPKINSAVQRF